MWYFLISLIVTIIYVLFFVIYHVHIIHDFQMADIIIAIVGGSVLGISWIISIPGLIIPLIISFIKSDKQ